jgi:hypothetical protein
LIKEGGKINDDCIKKRGKDAKAHITVKLI